MRSALVSAAVLAAAVSGSLRSVAWEVDWTTCAGSEAATAIRACTRILQHGAAPADVRAIAYYDRAIARRALRQFPGAIDDLDRAMALKPEFAAALVERGIVHYEMRQYALAVADDTAAIAASSELAEAWNNRSLAHLKLGQYEEATADFNRTIRLHQNYGNALINRSLGPLAPERRQ